MSPSWPVNCLREMKSLSWKGQIGLNSGNEWTEKLPRKQNKSLQFQDDFQKDFHSRIQTPRIKRSYSTPSTLIFPPQTNIRSRKRNPKNHLQFICRKVPINHPPEVPSTSHNSSLSYDGKCISSI